MKKYYTPGYSKELVVSNDILTASTDNGVSKTVEAVYGENGEELGSKTIFSFSLKNFFKS